MNPPKISVFVAIVLITLCCFASLTRAEVGAQNQASALSPEDITDFEHEDAFIDLPDALRNPRFVQRSILSAAITDSSRFRLGRYYINHLMGFSAVLTMGDQSVAQWMKYVSGVQGLAFGYVNKGGHAFELGLQFSSVSSAQGYYRFYIRPKSFSLWPFVGAGMGWEIKALSISDGPYEARLYKGKQEMLLGSIGFLVPLVDVGIKAEIQVSISGRDRFMLTSGLGAILFL
ncbi:MAG: hypothetical protein HY537_05685 [Deltaproteobacteria bacterium]|nr:hypothetical protein [Deltaproteobacteria bacterium]